jgi:hypothetical protein
VSNQSASGAAPLASVSATVEGGWGNIFGKFEEQKVEQSAAKDQ